MFDGPEHSIHAVYSLTKVLSLQGSGPRLLVMAFPSSLSASNTHQAFMGVSPQEEWQAYAGVPGSCLLSSMSVQSSSTAKAETEATTEVAAIAKYLIATIVMSSQICLTNVVR